MPTVTAATIATAPATARRCRARRTGTSVSPGPAARATSRARSSKLFWRSKVSGTAALLVGAGTGVVVLGGELGCEGGAAAGEPRLEGSLRAALDPGGLGHRQPHEVVQDQGAPLGLRQLLQRPREQHRALARRADGLGRALPEQVPDGGARAPPPADRLPGRDLRTQAPASSYVRNVAHRGQARAYASCAASSAAERSPVTA